RLGQWVVVAQLLDEPAVARRARVSHHEAVERPAPGAHPPQPDFHQCVSNLLCFPNAGRSSAEQAGKPAQAPGRAAAPLAGFSAATPQPELLDQLLHLLTGLEHLVDLTHRGAAAGCDSPPPGAVDDLRPG